MLIGAATDAVSPTRGIGRWTLLFALGAATSAAWTQGGTLSVTIAYLSGVIAAVNVEIWFGSRCRPPEVLGDVIVSLLAVACADIVAGQVPQIRVWSEASASAAWIPLEAAGCVALIELAQYWLHRAKHRIDVLWTMHAVHHEPRRVNAANAGRVHPAEAALDASLVGLVLGVCPVSDAAVAVAAAIVGGSFLISHADIRVPLGPLRFVLNSPDVHRWHHARGSESRDCNYGDTLMIWDLVFGTFADPVQLGRPRRLGIRRRAPGHLWAALFGRRREPRMRPRLRSCGSDAGHVASSVMRAVRGTARRDPS